MNNSKGYQNRGDILIVDDELSSLRTISDMLTAEGYGVRGAPDGSTALMIVENEQPELILLDVRMPGMDGFEVCRQIKADEKSSGIPVLFLSALDETADKVKGFAAGGLDFITKPFQAEEVLARVDTHLVLSRLRKNLEEQISERTVEIKRFKHIVESTNNPIGLVDRNFIYQYVNEPYCQALKRSTNEIIGHSLPELFGRKFFETVMEPHYKRCFAGRNVNYQEWFNFPGWGRRYMDVRYYPFLEADGRIAAVVTNVHDITEIKRTEQALAEQLAFEKLTADVASQLTQTKPRQLEGAIDSILQSLGRFFKTQRAFLAQFTKDGKKLYHRRISAAEGMELPPFPFELDLAAVSPWFAQQIRMGNVINTGPALVDLPPESGDLPEQLKRVGIKSGIIVPVRVENRSIVALGLDSLDQPVEFPPPIVDRLKIVADMMGTTLHRIRAEKLIDEQLRFEDLISRLSATFIHIKASEIDKNIEHGLRIIAEFLDIECGHLLQFSRDQNEVTITHSFDREGTEHSPPGLYNAKLPWLVEKLLREDPIYFSLSTEFPEEAQAEKEHLTQQGIKSALICPLTAAGQSHGAIALSALKRERQWPDKLIEQFKILGEIFSNALLRKRADEKIGEAFVEIKELKDRLEQENIYLRNEIEINYQHDEIVGESTPLKMALSQVEKVAGQTTCVLIQGETGTGKELFARAIHKMSPRSKRSMLMVNCGALPGTLIESELFGREKGAFTGAVSREPGRFEVADGSTIFLDEISDLPIELQSKLLRVLEHGRFERLGSSKPISVDVRVIAATNHDLKKRVQEGQFRKDLYYRLGVFPINLPPLRERREDIPLLVWTFAGRLGKQMGKTIERISQKTMNLLQGYPWPGNVRELRNVIERAMIMSTDTTLRIDSLGFEDEISTPDATLKQVEKAHILKVLESTGWRVSGKHGAADVLGLKESTLRARMKKAGIKRQRPPAIRNGAVS